MKKTFIFILVLGMGTWAGADLLFNVNGVDVPNGGTIDVPVGTVFELQICSNFDYYQLPLSTGMISVDLTRAEIAGPPVDYDENLPGEWIIYEYGMDPEPTFYWLIECVYPGPGYYSLGLAPLFGIPLKCTAEGPVTVIVYDAWDFEEMISMTINQVPEPATLTLLGLGGLLIRRRNENRKGEGR